jgi:hypothetical protein
MSLDQLEPLPLPINNIPQSPSTQFSPLSTPTPLHQPQNYQHFCNNNLVTYPQQLFDSIYHSFVNQYDGQTFINCEKVMVNFGVI